MTSESRQSVSEESGAGPGLRLGLAVGGGEATWRAVGLLRRLHERGCMVELLLGPGVEEWVPRRTFAVARGGSIPEDEREREPSAWAIIGASEQELADLAAGGGWLAPVVGGVDGPLLVLEPGDPAKGPVWFRGPRRALEAQGAVFLASAVDEAQLVEAILAAAGPRDLEGATVLITAGPSREHLDPVRFLSSPSSGRMGVELAREAHRRGARVEFCLGPTDAVIPPGVSLHRFTSAEELDALVQGLAGSIDVAIAAAAVADWRPAERAPEKVKKTGDRRTVEMVRTPDVLAHLSATLGGQPGQAGRPFLVGFAAETENLVANARGKLVRKGLDLVVANRVDGPEGAFAAASSRATLVDGEGELELPLQIKGRLAAAILDRVASWWRERP